MAIGTSGQISLADIGWHVGRGWGSTVGIYEARNSYYQGINDASGPRPFANGQSGYEFDDWYGYGNEYSYCYAYGYLRESSTDTDMRVRTWNYYGAYVTESWFNKTEKGQSHHRHWHPNSILSGVVTLSGDADSGHLKLITSQYDTLEFQVVDASIYNSKSWTFQSTAGNIIIFPSNVEHLVEPYHGSEPRITLSFNTFVKGKIKINKFFG